VGSSFHGNSPLTYSRNGVSLATTGTSRVSDVNLLTYHATILLDRNPGENNELDQKGRCISTVWLVKAELPSAVDDSATSPLPRHEVITNSNPIDPALLDRQSSVPLSRLQSPSNLSFNRAEGSNSCRQTNIQDSSPIVNDRRSDGVASQRARPTARERLNVSTYLDLDMHTGAALSDSERSSAKATQSSPALHNDPGKLSQTWVELISSIDQHTQRR